MLYIRSMVRQFSFRIHLWTILSMMFLVFCDPNLVSGAEKYYYYLHISSFRLKIRAVQDIARLQNKGYNAITRYEQVANRGYWYRVYVGPFSSRREAKLKGLELRKKGLTDYTAIQKKQFLIQSDLKEKPKVVEKRIKTTPEILVSKVSPPQEEAVPIVKAPVETPPPEEKPSVREQPPAQITPAEERLAVEKTPPTPLAEPTLVSTKPSKKIMKKGHGRNVPQGNFAIGVKHTYLDVQTELIKRKCITSDGTTTTTEDISIESDKKDDFPTYMHLDTLLIRFGLTDYLEIFADLGAAYNEPSDLGFAYGGGVRLNLFELQGGRFKGLYSALQGQYLGGELEYEYTQAGGVKFKKEADWQEFTATVELGIARSRFAAYLGGAYFLHREETERRQLEDLSPSVVSLVFKDDLEEENSYGVYGGLTVNLSSAILVNIEGQIVNQERVFGALEYHF